MQSSAILQVATHGELQLHPNGTPQTFLIPQGFTLVKLSAVSPGVCNYISSKDMTATYHDLKRNVPYLLSVLEQAERGETFSQGLDPAFIQLFRGRDYLPPSSSGADSYTQEYVHADDRKYIVSVFRENSQVVDKLYLRNNREYFRHAFDYQIHWVNSTTSTTDIMTAINGPPTRTQKESFVYLHQMLNYLYHVGITKVFLVDFSCSTITQDRQEVSSRKARQVRRGTLSQQQYGGTMKLAKRKNHMKTRKQMQPMGKKENKKGNKKGNKKENKKGGKRKNKE